MRDMIKPSLSLFAICLITAFCLAFVNNMTKGTIAERTEKDAQEQRKQVLTEADSFKKLDDWQDEDESGLVRDVYAAYKGEDLVGYVFNAFPSGYGGEIAVTVGVGNSSKITGVRIGGNEETPGLGSKTADDKFTVQYQDKDINSDLVIVKKPASADNEIQAVSGATISSNAVTSAVQASAELGRKLLQEQNGGGVK